MPSDLIGKILAIGQVLAIPVLDILAFRAWQKTLRRELPQWRSRLGLFSIVLILLSWCAAIILISVGMISDRWVVMLALVALAGTILGFTLKGAARIEAVAAGVLLVVGVTNGVS